MSVHFTTEKIIDVTAEKELTPIVSIVSRREKELTPIVSSQSMIARLIVSIPFKDVKNHAKLPALVRDAIDRFRRRTQSG